MIYKSSSQWSFVRKRALLLYGTVNFLFTAAFISTVVVAVAYGVDSDLIQASHAFFVAAMFLFLAVSLAVFGWRLIYLVSVANVKIPFLKSKLQISMLTVILCFVFASRSIKDLLSGLNIATLDLSDPQKQPPLMQAILFSVYFFWEIIPATLVLVFFWRIPGANNEPIAPVPAPYYSVNQPAYVDENVPFIDSPSVGTKVRTTNQMFGNPQRLQSTDNELNTPTSRTPGKDATLSITPLNRANRPHFRQYGGYSTRSTLSDSLPGTDTPSESTAIGSPFATTPDV